MQLLYNCIIVRWNFLDSKILNISVAESFVEIKFCPVWRSMSLKLILIFRVYCNLLLHDSIFTVCSCQILQFSNKINTIRVFANNSHWKDLRFYFPGEENKIKYEERTVDIVNF